jgi:hypothetical protein
LIPTSSEEEISANPYTAVAPTSVKIAKIIALELRAQMELKQGKIAEALQMMRGATQLEDQLPLMAMPVPIKPSHELLADMLFLNKQYVDAYKEYVMQLKRTPNRTLAFEGLKKASEKINEQGLALPPGIRPYFNKLMIESP